MGIGNSVAPYLTGQNNGCANYVISENLYIAIRDQNLKSRLVPFGMSRLVSA